ncbi:hypothetical protein SAY86_011317 [Trapa natans]|uniref:Zinc finger CCCH domain-containing protein 1 n=1 Tax=Trapa natans TaxID=22666 RepID=A0AAN7LN14_TRANT|nr:hypothetical protein SAY86_011317 [Trapa natans]
MADSDKAQPAVTGGNVEESSDKQQSEPVCSFFRKPLRNKNIRKRTVEEDEEDDTKADSSLLHTHKKPQKMDNKLYFSTGTSKQSVHESEDKVEPQGGVFHYESSREVQVENDSRATATLETETEFTKDSRAIRERVLKQANDAISGKGKASSNEKLYKGIHGYTDYKAGFRREQTVSSEKAGGAHGPLRASAHIRVSARFDYQPDICKDYKETGYCGYGDSCKFMHDRGDYKSGWQLEKDWEEAEKARKRKIVMGVDDGDENEEDDEDEEGLPFACFICRQRFVDPVMTKCNHYFCEHCALKHHAKNKKCFVCNTPTLGIFNAAHEIRKKLAAEDKGK